MTGFVTFHSPNLVIVFFFITEFFLVIPLNMNELIVEHVNLLSVPLEAEGKILDTLSEV